jgi:hypothetical protein
LRELDDGIGLELVSLELRKNLWNQSTSTDPGKMERIMERRRSCLPLIGWSMAGWRYPRRAGGGAAPIWLEKRTSEGEKERRSHWFCLASSNGRDGSVRARTVGERAAWEIERRERKSGVGREEETTLDVVRSGHAEGTDGREGQSVVRHV